MTTWTKEQAAARFAEQTRDELAYTCYDSHKDFYGVKGHHMLSWAHETLMSWWLNHYEFDVAQQVWVNTEPFQGEDVVDLDEAYPTKEQLASDAWCEREADLRAAYDSGSMDRVAGIPLLRNMVVLADRALKSSYEDGWMAEDLRLRTGR